MPPFIFRSSAIARSLWVVFVFISHSTLHAAPPLEAVTFFVQPGQTYVPLNEAAKELRWDVQTNKAGQCIKIGDFAVRAGSLRCLNDGTELLNTDDLKKAGAEVEAGKEDGEMTIRRDKQRFTLVTSPKRVEVNLANQQLRAWQGSRLVLETRISSGGCTPAGKFAAGPFRARMHYSSLFDNAPMPWSVQINGHIFIHGFAHVPNYPASHGCIRLPLDGRNPARFFYEWIDNGSPVEVMKR
jgi:hypothetical protein